MGYIREGWSDLTYSCQSFFFIFHHHLIVWSTNYRMIYNSTWRSLLWWKLVGQIFSYWSYMGYIREGWSDLTYSCQSFFFYFSPSFDSMINKLSNDIQMDPMVCLLVEKCGGVLNNSDVFYWYMTLKYNWGLVQTNDMLSM